MFNDKIKKEIKLNSNYKNNYIYIFFPPKYYDYNNFLKFIYQSNYKKNKNTYIITTIFIFKNKINKFKKI